MQVIFNMFEQRPAASLFHAGESTGTAFIARVPFDSGSLVGHWTEETYDKWTPGSVPHTLFRGGRFRETLDRVEPLNKLSPRYSPPPPEPPMRLTPTPPHIPTAIPA